MDDPLWLHDLPKGPIREGGVVCSSSKASTVYGGLIFGHFDDLHSPFLPSAGLTRLFFSRGGKLHSHTRSSRRLREREAQKRKREGKKKNFPVQPVWDKGGPRCLNLTILTEKGWQEGLFSRDFPLHVRLFWT